MSLLDSLPARPLSGAEVQALDDDADDLAVAPGNYVPGEDAVYALVFVTGDAGHAAAFDPEREGWRLLESVGDDAEDPVATLQTAVREFGESTYEEFDHADVTADEGDPDPADVLADLQDSEEE